MKRTILVFGLIAGAIVSLMLLVTMLLNKSDPANFEWGEVVGYASMLLSFSLILVATKRYRDQYCNGVISFSNAFRLGLGITCIASVIYVVTWVFIYKVIYPNFVQDFGQYTIEHLKATGQSAVEISNAQRQMTEMFAWYDTWYGLVGITFLEIFPVGLLVSMLSALFLKSKSSRVTAASPETTRHS